MFSILGSIPRFDVTMNYVTWFGVIYLIASYIWFYQNKITFFVSDSNKIFAVLVAVSSFLYFKNLDIRHSRISYHPCVGALEVDCFCKQVYTHYENYLRKNDQYRNFLRKSGAER